MAGTTTAETKPNLHPNGKWFITIHDSQDVYGLPQPIPLRAFVQSGLPKSTSINSLVDVKQVKRARAWLQNVGNGNAPVSKQTSTPHVSTSAANPIANPAPRARTSAPKRKAKKAPKVKTRVPRSALWSDGAVDVDSYSYSEGLKELLREIDTGFGCVPGGGAYKESSFAWEWE